MVELAKPFGCTPCQFMFGEDQVEGKYQLGVT
jgi:hypothetical protein